MKGVYGIGNPLMDIVSQVDFNFLKAQGKKPGSMNLIGDREADNLLRKLVNTRMIPGGSCANTMRGLSWLQKRMDAFKKENFKLIYSGSVGTDDMGNLYIETMKKYGIEPIISKKSASTGVSIILVTPDHERTMFTNLGACRYYEPEDTNYNLLGECDFLYFVGFMWDTENQKRAIRKAVEHAKNRGVRIVFDLAGPFVVKRYREEFLAWIPDNVDILMGNTDEFNELTGIVDNDKEAIRSSSKFAPLVVMKRGEKGCMVANSFEPNAQIFNVEGYKVDTVDTTGAGDAFASGVIYGLLSGKTVAEAVDLGNWFASRIVMVEGCDYESITD